MKKSCFTIAALSAAVFAFMSTSALAGNRDLSWDDDDEDEETIVEPVAETASAAPVAAAEEAVPTSITTRVRLTRNGQVSIVSPKEVFKSGDKIKLLFTSNVDGYVYWLAEGSTGSYAVLYPHVKGGMDNQITKGQEYTVPARGSFRFDDNAGNETLLCIMSQTRLTDLDNAIAANDEDGTLDAVDSLSAENQASSSNRDLSWDDDDDEETGTNVVTQEIAPSEPFVSEYVLIHE